MIWRILFASRYSYLLQSNSKHLACSKIVAKECCPRSIWFLLTKLIIQVWHSKEFLKLKFLVLALVVISNVPFWDSYRTLLVGLLWNHSACVSLGFTLILFSRHLIKSTVNVNLYSLPVSALKSAARPTLHLQCTPDGARRLRGKPRRSHTTTSLVQPGDLLPPGPTTWVGQAACHQFVPNVLLGTASVQLPPEMKLMHDFPCTSSLLSTIARAKRCISRFT